MGSDWKRWEGQVVNGALPLVRFLGGSDHSAVFLTERVGGSPQKAAVKLIAARGDSEQQLSRWKQAAKLTHPALIRLYESGRCEIEGTPLLYVVMELAEENLSQVVPERALTMDEAKMMLPPVLKALSYVHGKGLIHGSLRPSNILATGDQVKVSSDTVRPPEEVGGKRPFSVYDAPETQKGTWSAATDAWALGVTLGEVLTQKLPSDRAQAQSLAGGIAQPLDTVVRGCLESDPVKRWTVAQINARLQPEQAALKEAVANGTTTAAAASPGKGSLVPWVVGIAALVVVALFLMLRGGSKGPEPSPEVKEVQAPTANAPVEKVAPPKREAKPSPAAGKPANKAVGEVTKGSVAQQVMPQVAPSARETIEGKIRVRVRVEVDPAGNVTNARLESAGPSKYFARIAVEAAREWKFTPPQVQGKAVASEWSLRFGFRRTDTEVVPNQVVP